MLLFVSIGMNVHFPKLRFIDDKSEIPICLQVNVFMCLYDDNDKKTGCNINLLDSIRNEDAFLNHLVSNMIWIKWQLRM